MSSRKERFLPSTRSDSRTPFQRDRDRVLYSPEFRRLSGVTQVVSASEGDFFHNRLTHSLKVAQVGRRLAELLLKKFPTERFEYWGGLDPDVVETAGLAHDLGHPPFGHDGEEVIGELVEELPGGFEGNAQSFRIVTRLAAHADNDPDQSVDSGLNLTRATLNAILKYPWTRNSRKKWGIYDSDTARFEWVSYEQCRGRRVIEAELMDWADDVTYAVHDLEDFYRAGLIPLHLLLHTAEGDRFLEAAVRRNAGLKENEDILENALRSALENVVLFLDGPYVGGRRQRMTINAALSALITRFIAGDTIQVCEPPGQQSISIDADIRLQVDLLKEVTYYYVIDHPRIASIRAGQREMLRKLFVIYMEVLAGGGKEALLPQATRDRRNSGDRLPRLAADLLAGMTERQVIQNYQRLTGIIPGPMSYFDL